VSAGRSRARLPDCSSSTTPCLSARMRSARDEEVRSRSRVPTTFEFSDTEITAAMAHRHAGRRRGRHAPGTVQDAMSEKWLTGRVIENRHWTDTLFSLRVEGAPLGFQPAIRAHRARHRWPACGARLFLRQSRRRMRCSSSMASSCRRGRSRRGSQRFRPVTPSSGGQSGGVPGPVRSARRADAVARFHRTGIAPSSRSAHRGAVEALQDIVVVHAVRHANE